MGDRQCIVEELIYNSNVDQFRGSSGSTNLCLAVGKTKSGTERLHATPSLGTRRRRAQVKAGAAPGYPEFRKGEPATKDAKSCFLETSCNDHHETIHEAAQQRVKTYW